MLKEIFLRKLNTQSKTVQNAIITLGDTDDTGKGKKFKSRFIQPGIAGYPGQFGNVLITKSTFDKFINTMIGVPVIINHKDLTVENADDERVGVVSSVWYDDKDGWYWCDGVIWNETAINLIQDKKWSVSCSYDVKLADDKGGTENNIPYDIEFLDGVFTHLAIVDNPRYERANIIFNSKTVVQNFNPNHDEKGRFCEKNGINPNYKEELKEVIEKAKNNPNERQKLTIGKVSKELERKAKEKGLDISGYEHDLDVSGTRHAFKEHGKEKTEELRGQIAITEEDFEKIPDVIYQYDEINFTGPNKIGRETITYKKAFEDGTIMYVEEIRDKKKTLTINTMYKHKNTGNPRTFVDNNNPLSNASTNIIPNSIDNLNPKDKEMLSKIHNAKEHEMGILEKFENLINEIKNSKGEEMDDDKKEKVDNEKVDKRKLIDEIGGILKGKVDEEVWRTIIGKAEKLSYNGSEDDKADNKKVKNESEEDKEKVEELKKDVKEDVENKKKCDNSVDNAKTDFFNKMNEVYNASTSIKEGNVYVSRESKLQAAKDYFSK